MPRSNSWENNLSKMHRSVKESARTPYSKGDLAKLFGVGMETAKKLLLLMPRTEQGNSHVVEREDLLSFLGQCIDAEDLKAHLDAIRARPPKASKRKLKAFIPREFDELNLLTRSPSIRLKRNEGTFFWTDRADYAAQVYQLIKFIDNPDFDRRYCTPPAPTQKEIEHAQEAKYFRAHNRYLGKVAAAQVAMQQKEQKLAELFRKEAGEAMAEIRELAPLLGFEADDVLERAWAMLDSLFPSAEPVVTSPPSPECSPQ